MLDTGLYDPTDAPHDSAWLPYNQAAAELSCCLEACKQITTLAPLFATAPHTPRSYTLLATPVLSLAEHTSKLYRMLARCDRSTWPSHDRENLTSAARLLKKQIDGPLRLLRNQLSAHQDAEALLPSSQVPRPKAGVVLPALSHALAVLILLHNHKDVFAYYRLPDPLKVAEVQIFVQYPLATLFRVDRGGKPLEILEVQLAADPRQETSAAVGAAISVYNAIASSASPEFPTIDIVSARARRHVLSGRQGSKPNFVIVLLGRANFFASRRVPR